MGASETLLLPFHTRLQKDRAYCCYSILYFSSGFDSKDRAPFLLATDMTLHKSLRKALYAGNDTVKKKFFLLSLSIFFSVSLWTDPEFYYESQLPTNFLLWIIITASRFVRGTDISTVRASLHKHPCHTRLFFFSSFPMKKRTFRVQAKSQICGQIFSLNWLKVKLSDLHWLNAIKTQAH